ncbi:unnamed protein product, partial [Phaeothamnion confervicola]
REPLLRFAWLQRSSHTLQSSDEAGRQTAGREKEGAGSRLEPSSYGICFAIPSRSFDSHRRPPLRQALAVASRWRLPRGRGIFQHFRRSLVFRAVKVSLVTRMGMKASGEEAVFDEMMASTPAADTGGHDETAAAKVSPTSPAGKNLWMSIWPGQAP